MSKTMSDLRKDLEEIRASAEAGDLPQVVQKVDHALSALDGSQLLTTGEAANLLQIRSVNTLKLLVRRLGVAFEMRGNRMMIPLAEVERMQQSQEVRDIRASDQAHDALEALGAPGGLTGPQLDDLAQSRPGRVPWQGAP